MAIDSVKRARWAGWHTSEKKKAAVRRNGCMPCHPGKKRGRPSRKELEHRARVDAVKKQFPLAAQMTPEELQRALEERENSLRELAAKSTPITGPSIL